MGFTQPTAYAAKKSDNNQTILSLVGGLEQNLALKSGKWHPRPGRAKYYFSKKIVSVFNMYCMRSKNRNKQKNNWMEKFNLPWKRPNFSSSDAILNNYQKITFSKKMYAANRQMVTLWLIMGCPILIKDLIISRVSVVKNNLLGTFFHYQ